MGEKGNLIDISEEVFANLAEQGPQFWLAYEEYKQAKSALANVNAGPEEGAAAPTAEWRRHPGAK